MRKLIPCPEPGVYDDVPEATYRCWDAAHQSFLTTLVQKSPMHAWDDWENPSEPTAGQEFGTAAHMMIMEPDRFQASYEVMPPGLDRRRKDGKARWAEAIAAGKMPIKDEDYLRLCAIESAMENHVLGQYLHDARHEVSIVWDDEETGVRCAGRLDCWFADGLIADLKFTSDARLRPTVRHVLDFGYDLQAAFYTDGAQQAFGREVDEYVLFCIEADRPFGICAYPMGEWVERGRGLYREALETYAHCKETNHWPGYQRGLVPLPIPAWA